MKRQVARSILPVAGRKELKLLLATNYKLHARKGFTLIELLVVVGVIAIVGALAADIFVNVTRSYNKAEILSRVERSGNTVLSQMAGEIRTAQTVISPARGSFGSSLTITNAEGTTVTFSFVPPTSNTNGYISRNGVSLTDNSYSTGVNVTSLSFSVVDANPLVVSVSLDLEQPLGAPGRLDFKADTTLQTSVSLRSYR